MPTALIADDEPHLLEHLAAELAVLWPELQIVARTANGPQALAALASHRPDVAFLDIRMPGANGLDVAREAGRSRVVFVTAYDQHALEAFERDALDYLLKPVSTERLAHTVAKLRFALASAVPPPDWAAIVARLAAPHAPTPKSLRWIRASRRGADGEVVEQIAVRDVLYVRADDKYTCVHARDGERLREWLIRVPLAELAGRLDAEQFVQVHRSVIVNLEAVASTRRDLAGKLWLRLRGVERELPVARPYAGLFRHM